MFDQFTYRQNVSAALVAGAAVLWVSSAAAQTMQQAMPQDAPVQMQQMEEPYPQTGSPQTQNQPGTMQPQGRMPWNEAMPQGQQPQTYGQGSAPQGYQGQGSTGYQGGYQQAYPGQRYQQQGQQGYQQQQYQLEQQKMGVQQGAGMQQQGAGVVPQTMPHMPQRSQIMRQEHTHTRIERYVPPIDSTRQGMEREALTPIPSEREGMEQAAVTNPGNVRFMSGGIGQEERDQFKAAEADFPVKLSFANRNGAFLSNVDVTIADRTGQTVLGLKTQGPILLVDLEPGNYTVKARDNGEVISRNITVSSSPRSYTVHFKAGAQDYSS